MKTLKQTLTSLSILLSTTFANAQAITCDDFSILGIGNDLVNSGSSLVHIKLASEEVNFINYPFISVVMDCNGDTIATGTMVFFGQLGQSVQSYPVNGNIENACLPLTVEFIFGNTNLENDTCFLSLSELQPAVLCSDFTPIGIETDQGNTLINISMQGTETTYIVNPRIRSVIDCTGDTIATGFINSSGQIGQTTQGYPITPFENTVCYPITIELVYGNTNLEIDTCLLTLDGTTGITDLSMVENQYSIFPNPATNQTSIHTDFKQIGSQFCLYDLTGKILLTGKIVSEITTLEMQNFSEGIYFLKIDNSLNKTTKVIKK